jgi:ribonuclease BN (tRNA processing enzyme)
MSLRFEVLGFAGAAPLDGACPSYVVATDQATVLLDCGPGTLERLWRRDLLGRLDAIVISHPHMDSVLDLLPLSGEIVRVLVGDRRIDLHVPAGGGRDVLNALDAAFPRGRSGTATRFDETFTLREYGPDDTLRIADLELTFAPTAHPQPCFAIRLTDGRTVVVYGADGAPSEAVEELAAGADLLVLEATLLDDEAAAAEHGHMTAGQAGELAARADAGQLLLTHLLPGAGFVFARLAARAFDGAVDLAREGWTYEARA